MFTQESAGATAELLGQETSESLKRSDFLARHLHPLTPAEFYTFAFAEHREGVRVMVQRNAKRGEQCHGFNAWEDLERLSIGRADASVAFTTFHRAINRQRLITEVLAFVVDLDEVEHFLFSELVDVLKNSSHRPNLVVNSGRGLHLVYLLDKPVRFHPANQDALRRINTAVADLYRDYARRTERDDFESHQGLHDWEGVLFERLDRPPLGQVFRVVGSLTKLDTEARGFLLEGRKYPVDELAELAGVRLRDVRSKSTTPRKPQKTRPQRDCQDHNAEARKARPGLYTGTLELVREKTQQGHRYTSMLALVTCAVKAHIPEATVRADLEKLVDRWNAQSGPRDKMARHEVDHAMRGYNRMGINVTSRRLEEWLGWTYPRRYRRSQGDHLKAVAESRTERTRATLGEAVRLLEADGVKVTARAISGFTGVALSTIARHARIRDGVVSWKS